MNIFIIIISLLVISIPVVFAESSNIGTIYWKQEIISSNSFAFTEAEIVLPFSK